jgi:uncharacterized RmlC-like cupin family protein
MPLTVSVPAVGASRAATQRSKVVLPQPEGPMKLTNSPRATESVTSFSAWTGPSAVSKTRSTPRASMTGASVRARVAALAVMLDPSGDTDALMPEGSAWRDRLCGPAGLRLRRGVSRESVGARAICMHLVTIPPGGRARAHKHATHETAVHVLSGRAVMAWGEEARASDGDGGGRHGPYPRRRAAPSLEPGARSGDGGGRATDPHEQESVVLLPELDGLVE